MCRLHAVGLQSLLWGRTRAKGKVFVRCALHPKSLISSAMFPTRPSSAATTPAVSSANSPKHVMWMERGITTHIYIHTTHTHTQTHTNKRTDIACGANRVGQFCTVSNRFVLSFCRRSDVPISNLCFATRKRIFRESLGIGFAERHRQQCGGKRKYENNSRKLFNDIDIVVCAISLFRFLSLSRAPPPKIDDWMDGWMNGWTNSIGQTNGDSSPHLRRAANTTVAADDDDDHHPFNFTEYIHNCYAETLKWMPNDRNHQVEMLVYGVRCT